VITAVVSLYLNIFVLVVQRFGKVSALNPLAPTQTEPPFAITQVRIGKSPRFGFALRRVLRSG
jgi:hypothetical protein